ncbi:flagellar basal body rod modification protein [Ligilactobacillus sp. WILCCON 0076]|uniref:Flagellar basal body rod modification protein n=1 Tax=Ligilactobacillus ubinensis TaxID=2876789 RepID=A0A9X2JLN2_9LACO|nr:flagellar hook capping FlgD N-terminal domain-containing protein [Ligilactobacillus ubinensis]MCP0886246.1 flagellar basal body rod modification protein [Ligilactobacillus ubinensis]
MDISSLSDAVASLSTNSALTSSSSSSSSSSELNMESFLKIMAASISNPSFTGDSSSSSSDSSTSYVSQLAQFSILQELTDLETTISQSAAIQQQQETLSLVGKKVTLSTDSGSEIEGTVTGAQFSNGYGTLLVNGNTYSMSDLVQVGDSN